MRTHVGHGAWRMSIESLLIHMLSARSKMHLQLVYTFLKSIPLRHMRK